jgi:hypothetical protein
MRLDFVALQAAGRGHRGNNRRPREASLTGPTEGKMHLVAVNFLAASNSIKSLTRNQFPKMSAIAATFASPISFSGSSAPAQLSSPTELQVLFFC